MTDIKYKRHLPHIHPEGHPLFITFRLADSLPAKVLAELKAQREQDLKSKLNLSLSERYDIERGFFSRYDEWLDRCEYGPRWLEDENIARIVTERIHTIDKNRYCLFAYCIMPNHGHLFIEPLSVSQVEHKGKSAKYPVTDSLRLIKGSSARACNLLLGRTGSFWHHESYDHYVRDDQELERIVRYVLNNPVKAGLVKDWTDWKFTYVNPELGDW